MNPETVEQIKVALAPVADKIGQGAEYGWEVLVKGQFAEGVSTLVICVVILVAVFFMGRKLFSKEWISNSDGLTAILGGIGGVFILTFISIFLYNGLLQTIAPEYTALKFLISLGR